MAAHLVFWERMASSRKWKNTRSMKDLHQRRRDAVRDSGRWSTSIRHHAGSVGGYSRVGSPQGGDTAAAANGDDGGVLGDGVVEA